MEMIQITSSEMPLFWYISEIFTKETTNNRFYISHQDSINKGIKSFLDKKSTLENCQALKQFLSHKKAEILFEGHEGPFISELLERLEKLLSILDTGIALGEKEQSYHSSPYYKSYPWFKEGETYNPDTLEGYLKLHAREFSTPNYGLSQFVNSGYFKHCVMRGWGAKASADTFCQLFNKSKIG